METTYTDARARLAELYDKVINDREVVIINRRGREDVALVAAGELYGLLELAHLFRSKANGDRLLVALAESRANKGTPYTIEELRAELTAAR